MNIDERLERLTERHEALAQSVEMIAHSIAQTAEENRQRDRRIEETYLRWEKSNQLFDRHYEEMNQQLGLRLQESNHLFDRCFEQITQPLNRALEGTHKLVFDGLNKLLQIGENQEKRLERLENGTS